MSAGQRKQGQARAPDRDEDLAELELDDVDIRDLLRKALDPPADEAKPDILAGVQQRIRERSKGRFYADGWSTSPAPRATFLVTSLVMLGVAVLAYWLLGPNSISLGGG